MSITAAPTRLLQRSLPLGLSSRTLRTTPLSCFHTAIPTCEARNEETATNRAERTMTRFWKTVSISPPLSSPPSASRPSTGSSATTPQGDQQEGYTIQLDNRPIKTPNGAKLVIPKERSLLACLVAQEWSEQTKTLKSHMLPLTSLVARAIDGCSDAKEREQICDSLLKYLETDTVFFFESEPPSLVRLQTEHWTPLLDWASTRFSVPLSPFPSLLSSSHAPSVLPTFSTLLRTLDALDLAAFERAVLATKSFLIPLALLSGHFSVEQAARAAEVEVQSQIERWGDVEDSHDVDRAEVRKMLGSVAVAVVRQ